MSLARRRRLFVSPKRLFALVAAFAVGGLVGCAGEPEGSLGQLGNLRFAYTCAGCSIEDEVLVGSTLDIRVAEVNPNVRYAVRSTAPEIAEFRSTAQCRFIGQEDCHEGITVVTKKAGDVGLEMIDAWTETVLDRVTVKVRSASSIQASVKVGARTLERGASGAYEITVGNVVQIVSVAKAENGRALIATDGALREAYADETVVGPANRSDIAKAKTPGTTTVSIIGAGARDELPFIVR